MDQSTTFLAHVEETFESAHANGPEGHKCREMHGHSWKAEIEFRYDSSQLDEYGWGPDFGRVKGLIRALDHRNLNDLFSFPPSAENISRYLLNQTYNMFPDLLWVRVTIHEGRGNMIRVEE